MSKELEKKQIEEMAKDLVKHSFFYNGGCLMNYSYAAKLLYEAGYHKQSECEWRIVSDYADSRIVECSNCEEHFYFKKKGQLNIDKMPYCPKCGAKAKGGE